MVRLNPAQQAAVDHVSGPLLILAGAGSGKTRVLTERIASLVENGHARPWEILAVTFTNKAAQELKTRLEAAWQQRPQGLWVGTFHAICARMLREDIEALGGPYRRNFVVYDEPEQVAIIKGGLQRFGLDDTIYSPRQVRGAISRAKSQAMSVEAFQEAAVGHQARQTADLYAYYQRELERQNALDFDDLLLLTVQLLRSCPSVLEKYQARFKFTLIDEYQDTNQTQYQWVSLLAQGGRNLCVVGDVDQSIYSFRSADFRIILQFQEDFPDATVVTLTENYRSTKRILDAANAVIANNTQRYPKDLWTSNPPGESITLYAAPDDRTEAAWVVSTIRQQLSDYDYCQVAVLYRTNAQSRSLEDVLMREGIPYRLIGGTRFYERREIKDALAYLRLLFNPADDAAFMRVVNVPKRGVGSTSLGRLAEAARERGVSMLQAAGELAVPGLGPKALKAISRFASWATGWHLQAETLPVPELLERVLEESGLLEDLREEATPEGRARLENVAELVSVARQFVEGSDDPSLPAFLMQMALISDLDAQSEGTAVTLMTLHSAKGLEFPVVFMVGCEEGLFPHQRTLDKPPELEEERRLCYVGITRAREKLLLSHAARRMVFGRMQDQLPSRFLLEIPAELLQQLGETDSERPGRRIAISSRREREDVTWTQDWGMEEARVKVKVPVPAAFAVGERVRHMAFGLGVVARVIGVGERACLAVSFPGLGTKILDLRFAPLEKMEE